MRRPGRPRAEVLLAGPFEVVSGESLVSALRRWDRGEMPLTWIADQIRSATSRTVTPNTVKRMIQRAHAEVRPVPSDVMVEPDGTARSTDKKRHPLTEGAESRVVALPEGDSALYRRRVM